MKIAYRLFGLFVATFHFGVQAQVILKMQHLPGHIYQSQNKTHIKEDIDYAGDTAVVNMTKKIGPPRGFEIWRETVVDNKIGKQTIKGLAFTMSLTTQSRTKQKTSEGIERELPSGMAKKENLYGYYSRGEHINIDSISNVKMSESIKVIYMQRLNETQSEITFPVTALKIGDTFTENKHISTPGAGLLDDMRAKTTYTLVAMQNEKAFFDTKTELSINTEGRQITMDMKGNGTGKMVYDMGINYPLSIQNNITVKYTVVPMQGPNVHMTGSLTINTEQQNTVTF